MITKKTIYLLFFLFANISTQAQTDSLTQKNSLIIETAFEHGGILASAELKEKTFNNNYYNGFDLRIGWRINKSKDVHYKIYNYPIYGIGFYTSSFNSSTIGKPYAFYGYVQTPINITNNDKWGFDYRIGLGLSSNFKPYNEENNPLNLALGTKNNVFIDFGIRGQYKFNNYLRAGLGFSFHHFSNGALRLPNKGINLIPLTVSLTYQPDGKKTTKDTSAIPPVTKEILYHINGAVGFKQIARDSQKRFFKSTISAYASKNINYKWRMGGGFDLFYSASGNSEEIAEDKTGKLSAKLSGGPALYIVHVLNNDLVLNGNIGYYIHNQEFNGEVNRIFLRAGFRYYVYKNINAGISIKAHKGQADYIEWTVGYTINRKP